MSVSDIDPFARALQVDPAFYLQPTVAYSETRGSSGSQNASVVANMWVVLKSMGLVWL